MLITKQTSREALERLDHERSDLTDQVSGMLSELEQIRSDAKQLVADRRQLEVCVNALRIEMEALHKKRTELIEQIRSFEARAEHAGVAEVIPPPVPAHSATLTDLPAAVAGESTAIDVDATDQNGGLQDALKVVAAHRQVDLEATSDPAEDQAFKEFFDSEIHPDKSRQWILS